MGFKALKICLLAWALGLLPLQALATPKGSVALSHVSVGLPKGETWGQMSSGEGCATQEPLVWRGPRSGIGDATYGEAFQKEAESAGFPAAPDSDFEVSARITGMQLEACLAPAGGAIAAKGKASLKVSWQVTLRADPSVTATIETSGEALIDQNDQKNIIKDALRLAFADNARALLHTTDFVAATRRTAPVPTLAPAPATQAADPFILTGALGAKPRPFAQSNDSVVAVFTSKGMGSGFLVSSDGALVTNAHVVGKDQQVKVRWSDGSESQAKVLRVDPKVDAALLQVAGDHRKPLALRRALPSPGDDVFAIGTPMEADLQGTLSRGIVSAIRVRDGATLIQSDVSITHGSSGGPLLDAKGNVVGMTVSGLENTTANLNFFIPVTEFLAALNLKLGS